MVSAVFHSPTKAMLDATSSPQPASAERGATGSRACRAH